MHSGSGRTTAKGGIIFLTTPDLTDDEGSQMEETEQPVCLRDFKSSVFLYTYSADGTEKVGNRGQQPNSFNR